MAPRPRINRRILLSFVLAVVLAGEVTGLALAVRVQGVPGTAAADGSSVGPTAALTSAARAHSAPARPTLDPSSTTTDATTAATQTEPRIRSASHNAGVVRPSIASPVRTTKATASKTKITTVRSTPEAASYRGRNHVWIPSLRINRSVSSFPCTRSRPPDNYVYRWGCAGRNNVYLLGHAYSVFDPLHDAYVSGRLKKGMKAYYADSAGHVQAYSVIWWKVTKPTTSSSWAWAAQARPSMTLQTCVGANSAYRLIVRLVAVG
jgi:hypothetical protein